MWFLYALNEPSYPTVTPSVVRSLECGGFGIFISEVTPLRPIFTIPFSRLISIFVFIDNTFSSNDFSTFSEIGLDCVADFGELILNGLCVDVVKRLQQSWGRLRFIFRMRNEVGTGCVEVLKLDDFSGICHLSFSVGCTIYVKNPIFLTALHSYNSHSCDNKNLACFIPVYEG